MNRKDKSAFRKLVQYIDLDKGRNCADRSHGIYWNINALDQEGVITAFQRNDGYRKARRGGNACYHIVISFSPKDNPNLTHEKMEKLAMKYLELRAPAGLAYGQIHEHQGHRHLHIILSANEYKSERATRVSSKRYREIGKEVEMYQVQNFPELEHSIVYLKEKNLNKFKNIDADRKRRQENEKALRKRSNKVLGKDYVSGKVKEIVEKSGTLELFIKSISNSEFEPYLYRGKMAGVMYHGKKYRFNTIGVSKENLINLEKRNELVRRKRQDKNRSISL
jgi:hypothetical protein